MDNITFYDDLYTLWYEPFYATWWFKLLIVVFVSVLLALCVYLYKRRTKAVTPCEYAIRKLNDLLEKNFVELQHPYYDLTTIVKQFCDVQFATNVSPLPDDELIALLKNNNVSVSLCESLQKLFERAALAKFAQVGNDAEQFQEDVRLCISFIEQVEPDHGDPSARKLVQDEQGSKS